MDFLTDDNKTNMWQVMDALAKFQNDCTVNTFIEIFGENMGLHIFREYQHGQRNPIRLWNYMDNGNRSLFIDHLSK